MKKILATLMAVISCSVLFTGCSGDNGNVSGTNSNNGTNGTNGTHSATSHVTSSSSIVSDAESKAGRVGNDIKRGIDDGVNDASRIVSDVLR